MKKVLVFILCFALFLSVCGCGSKGDNLSDKTATIDGENNTAVEVDICNENVRNYLNAKTVEEQFRLLNEFSGTPYDYQVLDLDWDYDGSLQYTVTISENADYSDAHTIMTSVMSIESTLLVPGKTYYWKVTGDFNDNILGEGVIKVKNAPVRWLKIDGTGNVRDMGGWKTENGKTVKYEMIYRGKALDAITDDGKATVEQLGIKTEIDIRGAWNKPNPPQIGLNYVFLDTGAQYDLIFDPISEEEVKRNYKEIFKLLSDKSNYPIYTHCSAGADRTGTFAFILNGLLGVSYEDLTRDFELTSFSSSGKRWRGNGNGTTFEADDLKMQVEGNHIAWGVLYKEMMENYGTDDGKLSSAIENFLVNFAGVPKSQIDSFKDIMLG